MVGYGLEYGIAGGVMDDLAQPAVDFHQGIGLFAASQQLAILMNPVDRFQVVIRGQFRTEPTHLPFDTQAGLVGVHHCLKFDLGDHGARAGDDAGQLLPRQPVKHLAHGGSADAEFLGKDMFIEDLPRCILQKENPALDFPIDVRVHANKAFLPAD